MTRRSIRLALAPEQRQELTDLRDHDPRPYVRERAAALLKIADGTSGLQVAQFGLLKPRDPDTIYAWVKRYQEQGIPGLMIRAGRGRKPTSASSS